MNQPKSNFYFKGMTFLFKIRDFFKPRIDILKEVIFMKYKKFLSIILILINIGSISANGLTYY